MDVVLPAIVGGLRRLIGWEAFLVVWAPPLPRWWSHRDLAVRCPQYQFEDAYCTVPPTGASRTRPCAAAPTSSCRSVLQFFTGNIGLHHVHHLNARIPNYNLQRAHDENPIFHQVPTLSLWDAAARRSAQAVGRRARKARHVRTGEPEAARRRRECRRSSAGRNRCSARWSADVALQAVVSADCRSLRHLRASVARHRRGVGSCQSL